MSEQITNALKSSSILYQIFAFVRNKKDRGRRCVIQYCVEQKLCTIDCIVTVFILQEKCMHSEVVCCQWYQLEGEPYGNDGSREGCFQVHCNRLRSRFFSIHFPQLSKEQGAHAGTHTYGFHRNVTYFIINKLWIVISHRRVFSRR